jgi:nucleoside phosphorylase/tetratricopeptide (TPR) repeat protein
VLVLTDRDNTPAAVQVERAITRFRPRVVLFVGVAGGRRDARIGDVVAASVIYNYEAGKDTDDGLRTRIKTLPSSFRLVQQAHAVVRERRWALRVKPVALADAPTASVQPLAAGTKVVAGHASETARLIDASCGDAQAIEMEGFGILHAAYVNREVEALVIRGVSDLLDGKSKTADRSTQPAAARNAAAFAFEILHRLKPDAPGTAQVGGRQPGTAGAVIQVGDGTNVANTGTVQGDLTVNAAEGSFRLEEFRAEAPLDLARARQSSLSVLLRASHQVVPFTGRATELAQLTAWRETPDRLSALLIFGPGGQGKTRLAAEFAAGSADEAGWAVANARHWSDLQDRQPVFGGVIGDQAGLLVVADYAERWPGGDLKKLLEHPLLRRAARVRLLLLARPADYWWQALAHPLSKLGATVAELPLGPLAGTAARRKAAFAVARDRFAEVLGVTDVARLRAPGSLADDAYELALTLHMAALVAVDACRRRTPAPGTPGQLSAYLVRREYDHWRTMRENRSISTGTLDMARLVAMATLTQTLAPADALDLLVAVGLAASPAQARVMLDDHGRCYPAVGGDGMAVEPLLPDRLGEDFLAQLLPDPGHVSTGGDGLVGVVREPAGAGAPDPWMGTIPARLASMPADSRLSEYVPAVLSMLIETGRRWSHVRDRYLAPLLRERPRLALAAGGAALVTLAGYADLELLTALEPALPGNRHVDLDSGIAALSRRLTDYGLARATSDAERAELFDHVADRLSNAGLYAEALAAARDAVMIRRRLARAEPDQQEPALARSLGNLGIDLWSTGESAAALDAMTEGADIYRRRTIADPGVYDEDLAAGLNNLAGSLISLRRHADALAPATEAATIFRQRAAAGSGYRHEVGSCLRNLAIIQAALDHAEEATVSARDAVEIYRELVAAQPETYLAELGDSLRSLSMRLSRLGQHDEALDAALESVQISRRLADINPHAHASGLAIGLANLANRRWDRGERERSLAVSEEAVLLERRLAEDNPGAAAPPLGTVLNSLARRLLECERPGEALPAAEEALAIWQRLATSAPGLHDAQLESAAATRNGALRALAARPGQI